MADWWKDLKDGEPRIFGFLQIDIIGSSSLSGPNAALMRTKVNLRNQLSGIGSIYDVMPLSWAGDGGVFALLVDRPESYDVLTQYALHLLETVSFFNEMKGISNMADSPISVRISCHTGQAIFNRDGSLFHGSELNAFLKNERKIGVPNFVVLTEAVYNQLTSEVLHNAFSLLDKKWLYTAERQSKTLRLYSSPKPSEKEEPKPKGIQKKLTEQDMVTLVARAFSKLGAQVKINAIIQGMEADMLLEEEVPTGSFATIVECKAYKSRVGVEVVQAFYGRLKQLEGRYVQRGIIVSTHGFTQQAKVVAKSMGMQLVTIDDLIQRCGGLDALPELPPKARTKPDIVPKRAFVVMPFKQELYDAYYFGIRQPLEQCGYVVDRADEMQFVGGIVEKIRKSIEEADLIIAEMTDLNPNVYYEVGLAHALNKRVILITQSIENLPFDLRGMRHIIYETAYDLLDKMTTLVQDIEKSPNSEKGHRS